MTKIKRGEDAADKARQAEQSQNEKGHQKKQDAPNYDKKTDDGQAIDPGDMSSANDE